MKIYVSRWEIETYFKSAKEYFELEDCKIRVEEAQRRRMTIVSVAYFVHNSSIKANYGKETFLRLRTRKCL